MSGRRRPLLSEEDPQQTPIRRPRDAAVKQAAPASLQDDLDREGYLAASPSLAATVSPAPPFPIPDRSGLLATTPAPPRQRDTPAPGDDDDEFGSLPLIQEDADTGSYSRYRHSTSYS